MAKVADLIKQIPLTAQDISPLVALNHYLRWFVSSEQDFGPSHMEEFFRWALSFEHWRQNPYMLASPINDFLADQGEEFLGFDLREVPNPSDWQVIEVASVENAALIAQKYYKARAKEGSEIKVLWEDLHATDFGMVFEKTQDDRITVSYFDRQFVLIRGQLEPLKTSLQLHYGSDLELSSEHSQKWLLPNGQWISFYVAENIIQGVQTKGPAFSAVAAIKSQPLHEIPRLFYSLKRIEQFFVARDSDPLFKQIVSALEKTIQNLRRREENAGLQASELGAKAQTLLENVFRGDNLLAYLINDLNQLLSKAGSLPGRRETSVKDTLSRETQAKQRIQSWPQSPPARQNPQSPQPDEHHLLLD